MSEQIKPCPWKDCREELTTRDSKGTGDTIVRCFQHTAWMTIEAWNTREDEWISGQIEPENEGGLYLVYTKSKDYETRGWFGVSKNDDLFFYMKILAPEKT